MKKDKKKFELKINEVNLAGIEYHYHIPVKVNGKTHQMVIDSGASRSVFDRNIFKELKNKSKVTSNPTLSAGIGTTISSDITTIDKFQIGGFRINKMITMLADLSQFNNMYSAFNVGRVIGLIGTDILKHGGVSLDFKNLKMKFDFDNKKLQTIAKNEVSRVKKHISI